MPSRCQGLRVPISSPFSSSFLSLPLPFLFPFLFLFLLLPLIPLLLPFFSRSSPSPPSFPPPHRNYQELSETPSSTSQVQSRLSTGLSAWYNTWWEEEVCLTGISQDTLPVEKAFASVGCIAVPSEGQLTQMRELSFSRDSLLPPHLLIFSFQWVGSLEYQALPLGGSVSWLSTVPER